MASHPIDISETRHRRLREASLEHSVRLAAMPGPRVDLKRYPPDFTWRRHVEHERMVLQTRAAMGYGEDVG